MVEVGGWGVSEEGEEDREGRGGVDGIMSCYGIGFVAQLTSVIKRVDGVIDSAFFCSVLDALDLRRWVGSRD